MSKPIEITKDMMIEATPIRPEDGHKGTFGRLLIVAGSKYMTGAAALCVKSALSSGVGIVQLYAPEEALLPTKVLCPCALTMAYPDDEIKAVSMLMALMRSATCVAIGPGLDPDDPRNSLLIECAIKNSPHLVIDASALNIIARNKIFYEKLLKNRKKDLLENAIITPHLGEFSRLIGQRNFHTEASEEKQIKECVQYARDIGVVTVLKTHKTIISNVGRKCYINTIGNNGMGKGGSGDVLTGLIGGLSAQGLPAERASVCGVYIHALSGDKAADKFGRRAMTPENIIECLPDAFAEIGWN